MGSSLKVLQWSLPMKSPTQPPNIEIKIIQNIQDAESASSELNQTEGKKPASTPLFQNAIKWVGKWFGRGDADPEN